MTSLNQLRPNHTELVLRFEHSPGGNDRCLGVFPDGGAERDLYCTCWDGIHHLFTIQFVVVFHPRVEPSSP